MENRSSKSVRTGDKHRTNRMFRRRIYAQGFTILAMIAGQVYWEQDRKKRKQFEGLVDEKQKKEKHEAWLRELEAREEEEEELRRMRDRMMRGRAAERAEMGEEERRALERQAKAEAGQTPGGVGAVRSVLEESERGGRILSAVRELWRGRK